MNEHDRLPEVDAETAIELSDGLSIALSDERRRRLLSVLSSGSACRTLDSLTDAVSSGTPGRRSEPATDDQLALTLHHCHLPKLADCGLVQYDSDRLEVELTRKGAQCAEIFGEMQNA